MKAHKREGDHMKDDTRLALLEQSIGHINETLLRMDKRFDSLEKNLDYRFERIDKRFDKIDEKFERVDERFNKIDEKFERTHDEIKEIRHQSWSQFKWIMGAILTLFGSFIAAMIKAHVT